jgi:hypothetical protein
MVVDVLLDTVELVHAVDVGLEPLPHVENVALLVPPVPPMFALIVVLVPFWVPPEAVPLPEPITLHRLGTIHGNDSEKVVLPSNNCPDLAEIV